jgi:hypothetical protein
MDFRGDFPETISAACAQNDPCTVFGEQPRSGFADAAAGASDENDPVRNGAGGVRADVRHDAAPVNLKVMTGRSLLSAVATMDTQSYEVIACSSRSLAQDVESWSEPVCMCASQ